MKYGQDILYDKTGKEAIKKIKEKNDTPQTR